MISNSREKEYSAKQEDKGSDSKVNKGASSSRSHPSSSRSQWSGLKDPRVVRVSRSFGGKDRHSKVCTIRGLRDRRVRLSVPTAIQLYDLQDRLGLNQPSKVVDWLLNVAKNEIDELPPLPISPAHFSQFPQSMIPSHDQVSGFQSSFASLVDANIDLAKEGRPHALQSSKVGFPGEDQTPKSTFWNLNAPSREERNEQDSQGDMESLNAPRATNNPSFSGLLNNMVPYNPFYHWDPSGLSLSGSHGFSIQSEDAQNYNAVPQLSIPPSQLLLCPSGTTPSFFSPYITTQVDNNSRPINHLQMLSSTSQNITTNPLTRTPYALNQSIVRPLQLGLTPNFFSSYTQNASHSSKGNSSSPSHPDNPKSTF